VCGNHDVGDRPTPRSLRLWETEYGADYGAFWCGGMRGLVLNSQLISDPADAPEEAAAQNAWLERELSSLTQAVGDGAPKARHVVCFQHIPWFLRDEHEPQEGYFNIEPDTRARWVRRLTNAGVSKVFCGHYHRNLSSTTRDGKLEVVVTSAVGRQMSAEECRVNGPVMTTCSDTRSGMRTVLVGEDSIHHEYRSFDDLEVALAVDQLRDKDGPAAISTIIC